MVSGSKLLPGKRAIKYARNRGGEEEATVVGTTLRTTVEQAALANGMMAHADETDDSHAGSVTHPGCAVIPAALAVGERQHRKGSSFLRAVALGYDVGARFSMALDARGFFSKGHSTHSFSPSLGAAAAAAAMSKLDATQVRHTLSYAGQQASGVGAWIHDLEHVEKAFDFGGMPARNGVLAATFVRLGFTAVDDLFVGPRNFFPAYGTKDRPTNPGELVRELGVRYEIMNTNIKRWTVGSPIQAAHDEPRMRDKRTTELRERIELIGVEGYEIEFPGWQGTVDVLLKDGRTLHHHTATVRGTSENPMTRVTCAATRWHAPSPRSALSALESPRRPRRSAVRARSPVAAP